MRVTDQSELTGGQPRADLTARRPACTMVPGP
jgi:hypothetical protein